MTPLFAALAEMGRIRLALFVLAVLLFALTFESIRRTQLKERYALLWIVPCLLMMLLAAFPRALDWMRDTFGMTYSSSMSAVVFLSMMWGLFVLSRTISQNERNLAKIAQRCASLEARLRAMEEKRDR